MSRSHRRHERWRGRAPRHARGGLPAPGHAVRRRASSGRRACCRAAWSRWAPRRRGRRRRTDTASPACPGRPRVTAGLRRRCWWSGPSTSASPRRSRRPATPAISVTVLEEVFQGSVVRYQLDGPAGVRLTGDRCRWRSAPTSTRASRRGRVAAGLGLRPAARVATRAAPVRRDRNAVDCRQCHRRSLISRSRRSGSTGRRGDADRAGRRPRSWCRHRSSRSERGTRAGGGHGRGRPPRRARSDLQRPRCRAARRQGRRSGVDVPRRARRRLALAGTGRTQPAARRRASLNSSATGSPPATSDPRSSPIRSWTWRDRAPIGARSAPTVERGACGSCRPTARRSAEVDARDPARDVAGRARPRRRRRSAQEPDEVATLRLAVALRRRIRPAGDRARSCRWRRRDRSPTRSSTGEAMDDLEPTRARSALELLDGALDERRLRLGRRAQRHGGLPGHRAAARRCSPATASGCGSPG